MEDNQMHAFCQIPGINDNLSIELPQFSYKYGRMIDHGMNVDALLYREMCRSNSFGVLYCKDLVGGGDNSNILLLKVQAFLNQVFLGIRVKPITESGTHLLAYVHIFGG